MPFSGFSEATHIYVEGLPTIEALRDRFHQEVDAYFGELRSGLQQSGVLRERLRESPTFDRQGELRYWSLSDDGTLHRSRPRLWVYVQNPRVVTAGEVLFSIALPYSTPERRAQVRDLVVEPELEPFCRRPTKEGDWALFNLAIPCDPQEMATAVKVLAHVLNRLRSLELSWLAGGSSPTEIEAPPG